MANHHTKAACLKTKGKGGANFMAALLAPLPADDLIDKGLDRDLDRASRAAKKLRDRNWHEVWLLVQEAKCLRDAAAWKRARDRSPESDEHHRLAVQRVHDETARLMAMPAVIIRHLRWKEDNRKVGGQEENFAPMIEADRVRLGAVARKGK